MLTTQPAVTPVRDVATASRRIGGCAAPDDCACCDACIIAQAARHASATCHCGPCVFVRSDRWRRDDEVIAAREADRPLLTSIIREARAAGRVAPQEAIYLRWFGERCPDAGQHDDRCESGACGHWQSAHDKAGCHARDDDGKRCACGEFVAVAA